MESVRGVDVLVLQCDELPDGSVDALDDLLTYFDPDLVYVPQDGRDMRVVSRVERSFDGPVLAPSVEAGGRVVERDGVRIRVVDAVERLDEPPDDADATAQGEAVYVVCDDVGPTTDAVRMEADLAGRDELAGYLASSERPTTVLTGSFDATYEHVWNADHRGERVDLPVHGLGPVRRSGHPEIPLVSLDNRGNVAVRSAPADRFGLRAVSGVGPTTAGRLADAGYDGRAAVAAASVDDLAAVDGIGASRARTVSRSARALVEGTVVRTSETPVPPEADDPVFVDIETDGLTPSIIWLVGVYDAASDEYVDFVDRDPSLDDPGAATRDFVSWLAATYDAVSLVTWNGHQFDFPHLERFVARHAPAFLDYWEEAVTKYDLYDWATRRGNAVLPGRTNRLADVASALGRGRETGSAVDGHSLARSVRRLLREPDGDATVDWAAARDYCEADVRELAAVHEEMTLAMPDAAGDTTGDEETIQTGLADF